jgi:hypothetical protein
MSKTKIRIFKRDANIDNVVEHSAINVTVQKSTEEIFLDLLKGVEKIFKV